jgi:hypothetical protein
MSNENVSKELVRIANACLNKKADSDELYNYVKNILDTNDYILDEVLEDAMEYTNNFEIIKMLQEISEITSYCKSIVGKDKKHIVLIFLRFHLFLSKRRVLLLNLLKILK